MSAKAKKIRIELDRIELDQTETKFLQLVNKNYYRLRIFDDGDLISEYKTFIDKKLRDKAKDLDIESIASFLFNCQFRENFESLPIE